MALKLGIALYGIVAQPTKTATERVVPLNAVALPRSISNAFVGLARRAGVRARLHDLRHTAATWLLQGGTDVRAVAAVLGHTTATTTLTTYAHVLAGAQARAVEQISERLRGTAAGRS